MKGMWTFLCLFLLCLSRGAWAADVFSLLCDSSGKEPFLRPCHEVLQGSSGVKGLLPLLESSIATYARNVYVHGIGTSQVQIQHPTGQPVIGPVCSLSAIPFNGCQREGDTTANTAANFLGNGCGSFGTIDPTYKKDSKNQVIGVDVEVKLAPRVEDSREIGYKNGLWLALLANHLAQIKDELSSNELKVSGSCKAPADDTTQSMQALRTLNTQMKVYAGATSSTALWHCNDLGDSADAEANSTPATEKAARIRQSQQYACAARASIEIAGLHVAACEVHARAVASYIKAVESNGGLIARLEDVADAAADSCRKKCGTASDQPKCIDACLPDKYREGVLQFFKNSAAHEGKSDNSCIPATGGQ